MKKRLSVLLLASGGAAVIRLLQAFFGYEAETGLPVRSLLFTLPVVALLLLWPLAVRSLPADDTPALPQDFSLNKNELFLPVAGLLLVALNGLGWLVCGLLPGTASAVTGNGTMISVMTVGDVNPRTMTVLGLLSLVMAVTLFPAVAACRVQEESPKPFQSSILLAAPVVLVIRLVLIYRINSVDPILSHSWVELLAMVCLTLAFYRLSGFGCGVGNSRRFALYAGWAVIFSVATLPDGHGFPDTLFYLGAALTMLGLLLPRLEATKTV